ncbi:MAG: protein translocase subunit SecD, partial [Pseudomonadota bacterium]
FVGKERLEAFPDWVPANQLVLGLDLQGGSHLLLEVETDVIRDEFVESVRDDVRRVLRDARIGYTGLRSDDQRIVVRIRDAENVDTARQRLREITTSGQQVLFSGQLSQDIELDTGEANQFILTLTDEGVQRRISSAVEQSIEIVRRRIDELGTTEPNIQRQGADRILVQVPGLQDPSRLKALLGQTAKMSFRLVDQNASIQDILGGARPPVGTELLYSQDDPPFPYVIETRIMVSGENLVDAQPGFDQQTSEPIVTFRFDTSGARRFGQATQQNVGRPFAIVLDEEVISAPVIREPILGGSGQISGQFSVEEANDLAILLRAGALPAPLTILEERTVGPGLGADSVAAGERAALVALGLVMVFMIAAYGLFGIFSAIALISNVAILMGLLSVLQATLTLPGIAGIVLTVGMAVDANVLIYERIREEARAGKAAISAIDAGFSRALSTILDANITTFIAAIILFYLGSGPIRGFAVTLAIGILTTVFTAFTLTRFLIAMWVRSKRPSAVPI